MAAVYPTDIKQFTNKIDNTDAVIASDVNLLYAEVSQIETTLGKTPSVPDWAHSFSQAGTDFNTVTERLGNIEGGLNTAYNARVKTTGGSVITQPDASTLGVGLTAFSDVSLNLLEAKNSAGTVITAIGPKGWILAIDGGSAA